LPDAPDFALRAARAVLAVLDSFGVPSLALKPPNDVFACGRKIAGILLEPRADPSGALDFAILGIGVNALHNLSDFPPALRPTATSCRLCGVPVAPADLIFPLSRALFPPPEAPRVP
ncbi:MAG: hypothetical protein IK066_07105, partial [Kiritimatiellae bacterium]|nr:hypothetical protein [Kiritimatiellia bacterium]